MKKSSKRFTISSEAVNSHGFRVRTSGIDLTDFNNNPLLLWMHKRPTGERRDEVLPLGFVGDLELSEDGKLTGVPNYDDTDDFAMTIFNKTENGTIKMCSAGLKPIEFETINGEKWLTKSSLQEVSICDIGSNKDALSIALYNDDNELIKLADFNQNFNSNKEDMKLLELSAASVLPLLKLKEDANAAEAHAAILNLVTLSENQKTQIETLTTEKTDLAEKLALAEGAEEKNALVALVNKAKDDRKITADQVPHYIALAEKDPTTTKAILDSMEAAPEVNASLNKGDKKSVDLVKLSWLELEEKGKLVQLKEENLDAFKEKFKDQFGAEYKS